MEEMSVEEKNSGRRRADIVIWRSRYLKEVQEYQDNRHWIVYMHKTWRDSNLTVHKCRQEGEVMGIHTYVNLGNWLIMLHVGESLDFFLCAHLIYVGRSNINRPLSVANSE